MSVQHIMRCWKRRFLLLFSSNIWTFFIVLFLVTFLVALPMLCSDWAHSTYLAKSFWTLPRLRSRAIEENEARSSAARSYFSGVKEKNAFKTHTGDVDLAVAVVTIRRSNGPEPLFYLTQVMSALHLALNTYGDLFPQKHVFICNVFAGPGPHYEADQLSEFFLLKTRFPNGSVSATIMDRFEKEKEDYVYCMQQALSVNPKHVLIIEDDASPHQDLFRIINHILSRPKLQSSAYAFVKLYYPERWQGFSFELRRSLELIGIGLIGGCSFVFLMYALYSRYIPEARIFLYGVLYSMTLAYAIGRPYLLELRRLAPSLYTLNPSADCCSPSILYPQGITTSLMRFLNDTTCHHDFAIDLALDMFVHEHGHQRYSLEPNLFKHIGFMSTIKGMSQRPEEFLYL